MLKLLGVLNFALVHTVVLGLKYTKWTFIIQVYDCPCSITVMFLTIKFVLDFYVLWIYFVFYVVLVWNPKHFIYQFVFITKIG